MTDELDDIQDEIRNYAANFSDTQGFIATTNVWTMTEAAELLAPYHSAGVIAALSAEQRAQALVTIIGQLIRQSLTVSPIRDELLIGAGGNPSASYSGHSELPSGEIPAVFADVPDDDDIKEH